jgi:hypothetical protein
MSSLIYHHAALHLDQLQHQLFLVTYHCLSELIIEENPTFFGSRMDITRLGGQWFFNNFDHVVGCVF